MDILKRVRFEVAFWQKAKGLGYSPFKTLLYEFIPKKRAQMREEEKHEAVNIAFKKYSLKFLENSDVREVFNDKIYTTHEEFIPHKNDIVIDVGAQFGDYAILCAKYYNAKVWSFEPLKDNFKIFEQNIKLNKISGKRLKCYNIALGKQRKAIYLHYSKNMIKNMISSTGIDKKQKVYVRTLDSFKTKPTILKIDVEGFELDVLKGAVRTLRSWHPKIIIETHSKKLKEQTLDFLSEFGYSLKYEGGKGRIYDSKGALDIYQNLFLE